MATSKISEHSVEYIADLVAFSNHDITSSVTKYSALIIEGWCNARAGISTLTIPTHFIKQYILSGAYGRFDMGGYASPTAFMDVSVLIGRTGDTYTITPNFAATEAGAGDVHIVMYGLK